MTTYDPAEAAAAAGIEQGLADQFWIALGFPLVQIGEKVFTEEDVEALRFAADLIESGSVPEPVVLQMTRTIASSIARIAEAQVEVATERARRLGEGDAGVLLEGDVVERMPWILGYVWRRHVESAFRRAVETGTDDVPLTVGFADLVGFTAVSQQVSENELAALVDRFTRVTYETIVSLGGRVIKTIGDEVMFAAPAPKVAVEIGLALAERHRDDEELSDVRVGIACGSVLDHDGDLFGPPVNLASRITGIARPGAVVVSQEVREAIGDDDAYEWRSLRPRTLKGIGKVPLHRARRAG